MPAGVLEPRLDRDQDLERRHDLVSHPLVMGGMRARAARCDPAWRRTVAARRAKAAGGRDMAPRRAITTGPRTIAAGRRAVTTGRRAEAGLRRRRRGAERRRLRAGLESGLRPSGV